MRDDVTLSSRAMWRQIGPEGGYFKSFAWDAGGRAYAGSDDSGGVWGSDDDGLTWRLLTGAWRDCTGWKILAVEGAVYLLDEYARHPLLVSRDHGETWREAGDNLPADKSSRRTSCLVAEGDRLLCGTGHDMMHPGNGLFLSEDGGGSWRQVAFAGYDVAEITRAGKAIFAAVHSEARDERLGLMRSDDGGLTWAAVPRFAGAGVSALSWDGGELLVGAWLPEGSVWRSRDGGE